MGSFLDFLGSPGGAAAIRAAGGAAAAYGQAQSADANRQVIGAYRGAQVLQNESYLDRLAASAAQAPIGESQSFVGRNSVLNVLLPTMRNFDSHTGQRPGRGSFLPEGGLDPTMVNSLYGPGATLESLAQRGKQLAAVNPSAPQENLENYGFAPSQVQPVASNIDNYQQTQRTAQQTLKDNITRLAQLLSGTASPLATAIGTPTSATGSV